VTAFDLLIRGAAGPGDLGVRDGLIAAVGLVPSAGGISHHPDEYTAPHQLDAGVRVLAGVLARLSAAQKPSRLTSL
jgi:acetylornithine deacetylase/succinyl-diaminopimelate desuccinylase-like protein